MHKDVRNGQVTHELQHSTVDCTACVPSIRESLLTYLMVHMPQVRMQAEGKLPAGMPRKYPSAFAAYAIIARCGLRQRWRLTAVPEVPRRPPPLTSLL
jgi:hypothetical protein